MKKLTLAKLMVSNGEVLTRAQLKNVLGGSLPITTRRTFCQNETDCSYYESGTGPVTGKCGENSKGDCVCVAKNSSIVTDACAAA